MSNFQVYRTEFEVAYSTLSHRIGGSGGGGREWEVLFDEAGPAI